jgi:hypothetical protein
MSYQVNHVKLPLEKDKYVMTQEAVDIIKQASYFHACFEIRNRERVERNCWLQVGVPQMVAKRKVEVVFEMPINVCRISTYEYDWKFFSRAEHIGNRRELHPIQGLIRKGSILEFEPYEGAHTTNQLKAANLVGDVVYWNLLVGKDQYRNIFETRISVPDSTIRLVQRTPNNLIYSIREAS